MVPRNSLIAVALSLPVGHQSSAALDPHPPKSEGIIFVRQSINHLKWADQHSLQSSTALESRTFPLLVATRDPAVNKVDPAQRSGNRTVSTPCLTQSLGSTDILTHLVSQSGVSTSRGFSYGLRMFGHLPSFIVMTL